MSLSLQATRISRCFHTATEGLLQGEDVLASSSCRSWASSTPHPTISTFSVAFSPSSSSLLPLNEFQYSFALTRIGSGMTLVSMDMTTCSTLAADHQVG